MVPGLMPFMARRNRGGNCFFVIIVPACLYSAILANLTLRERVNRRRVQTVQFIVQIGEDCRVTVGNSRGLICRTPEDLP